MSVEEDLTQALIDTYRRTGRELGYWARRFLASLKKEGGLATARRMLTPRTSQQRKGLDVLLNANRPDLSLEAVVLGRKYRRLFTEAELVVARERLKEFDLSAKARTGPNDAGFPDELPDGELYSEGKRKVVYVNAVERDPKARKACLRHYGVRCSVCNFDFESTYGPIGHRFIHVHHLYPLSLRKRSYKVNPITHLRPVCPNCHAMLHRRNPPLTLAALRRSLKTDA